MRELKGEDGIDLDQCHVTPENLAALLVLIDKGTISGKIAKTVFEEMLASGKDAETVVKEKNLVQMSDEGEPGGDGAGNPRRQPGSGRPVQGGED